MVDATFDDGQFIELVQQYPIIWNRKDPGHSNKLKIENAWTTIAEIMNASAEFCETRWANIRHRFAKERRLAQRPSGSGSYTIIWPLYNACSFLEDVVITRKTVGNIKKNPVTATATATVSSPREQSRMLWDTTQDIFSGQGEPGGSQTETEDTLIDIEQPDLETHPPFSEGDETRSGSSSRLSTLRQSRPKKRKREDEGAALAELSSTISSAFKNIEGITDTLQDSEKNDEDFVFGRTVAVMMKDVKGKKKKAILKSKIITLIAESTDDDDM